MVSLSQQQQQQQQYTLGFLKPDVMDRKTEILELIKTKSFWNLTFEKDLSLSFEDAKLLYSQDDIATWLSSYSIYVFVLKGPNVVKNWYKYAGPKDAMKAKQISPQSLRAIYGLDDIQNVCHASSSDKEAQRDLTWLQNLLPDYRLSIPLDTGSASFSEQRSQDTPTKPASSSLAASTFNPNHPAAAKSKHLLTNSDLLSPSSLSTLPKLNKKQLLTKQSMALARPNPSLATPSKELKPATQVNPTPQNQKPNPPKYPLSKTAKIQAVRQETKTPRSKDRLVPLTDKPSSDSAKAMGYNNIKRLSNPQGLSKINPGTSVTSKQQQQQQLLPRKLSQMEKHQKDAVAVDSNNAHPQPQQLKDDSESEKHDTSSSSQSSESNNSSTLGNGMMTSPVALSPPIHSNVNDEHHHHHHQYIHDDNYPTTTASSSSSHSNVSIVSSTSTLTVDNDHHDKEIALPLSATVNTIRVVTSPTSNLIHRHIPPDVDNLRHEFEALCQNKQAAMVVPRTPSSTTTSPYLASRIKDLKPKNPSGSRVKSMVDFFMDENLHKWEF